MGSLRHRRKGRAGEGHAMDIAFMPVRIKGKDADHAVGVEVKLFESRSSLWLAPMMLFTMARSAVESRLMGRSAYRRAHTFEAVLADMDAALARLQEVRERMALQAAADLYAADPDIRKRTEALLDGYKRGEVKGLTEADIRAKIAANGK